MLTKFFFPRVAATNFPKEENKLSQKIRRRERFDSVLYSTRHCGLSLCTDGAMLPRRPRMHKTEVPPAAAVCPPLQPNAFCALSPDGCVNYKSFEKRSIWHLRHPPSPPPLPHPTDAFPFVFVLLRTLRPTEARGGRSRDVLCRGIITTQPLAFLRLGGREEVIYWQRKAAVSRRVLIHQRAEHQVCAERHAQCTVRRIILQNLALPCSPFLFSSLLFFF